ncbi:hypothetical protein [Shimazuella alba]|nr:hypothetical protein [Shimazuella alba]
MIPILREGGTIQTKDGHRGAVFYINRRLSIIKRSAEMIIMSL